MKRFLLATAVLMSTIVGVGMFSLSYISVQSGFLIATVFLLFLALIMTIIHLFYGEIVCRTKERHRLVGYAEKYLGTWGKRIVSISVIIGFYGSLLVYIIVGGNFLHALFPSALNIDPIFFNLIFFIIGAVAVYCGLRFIAGLDIFLGFSLLSIVLLFFYFGHSQINIDNFKSVNWHNFFIPYGAILYSLAGLSAVPEIGDFFAGKKKFFYKKSILWGTLIPAVLYFIFMLTVVGLTGSKTTEEAISGLRALLGERVVLWGALFGFLATITSFWSIGLSLKETFKCDYKISNKIAWFLVCVIPLVLFVFGVYNFITIIVLIGALLGAVEGTAVVLIYQKAKKFGNQATDYNLKIPNILGHIIILVFVIGFILTWYFELRS